MDAGLSSAELEAKTSLFARALAALPADARDLFAWWVPGRIEFLGKHTDYAGGRSLLCAAERGFAVVAAARADGRVSVRDASSGESAETELSVEGAARPAEGHWSTYPFTVARRVARNFRRPLRGVDLAFASDLPPASGLSSSSALVVGTFLALADANDLASRSEYAAAIRTPEDLAEYLGCIENGEAFRDLAGDRGVGTRGGSQDHTAILCARPSRLAQYAFAPVQFERQVPFPSDHALVVAASGVAAAKTGDAMKAYNRAAQRAAAALHAWRLGTGSRAKTLATALAEAPNAVSRLRELSVLVARFSADSLVDRAEQLRQECEEIIPRAGDSLTAEDFAQLGALVDRSQTNAETLLGNQVPETIELARSARELGAVAASAFGAGYGGSVYALVRAGEADAFRQRWAERYTKAFPEAAARATFFTTRAGPPATRLRPD